MSSSILLFPRPRSLEPGSGFLSLPAEAAEGSLPAFFAALKQGLPSVRLASDPALAKEFIEATGVDALACSFGTTHGIFLKAPKLDFDVVRRVRELANDIPIVMHGASGVSTEDLHRSIDAGVAKINYFTYMDKAGGAAAAEAAKAVPEGRPVFFSTLMRAGREAMRLDVLQAMKVFAKMI